ncbi:hypothetical protein ACHQM5_003866 [Ranunculus cassubicifolius]
MDLSGQLKQFTWNATSQQWVLFWSLPSQCEVYAFCGAYGVCNQNSLPLCTCMEGFEPGSPKNWYGSRDYSNGCVRKTLSYCEDKITFLLLANVKFPENKQSSSLEHIDCRLTCQNSCTCVAYAYTRVCFIWNEDLLNVKEHPGSDDLAGDLYIKLTVTEVKDSYIVNSGRKKKGKKIGIIVGVVAFVLALAWIVIYFGLKKKPYRKVDKSNEEDLPLIDLHTIETATNNFSSSNKIGKGGFGPVYKGVLPTGEEVAIKKLSKDSKQGLGEFMNEVLLISKLQHRNLVRLLGCCIDGDERMLVYEYMPNKSLDLIIFDKTRGINLNWGKRYEIIMGITHGLLYLHRDSRLRIIHRDLKAANILLDFKMNPKISDFGIARALGGDQIKENTKRVVGTYGYISPEYARNGVFSVKSDVFSFGVLVIEIISGNRNRGFHHADHDLNLIGHAWKLLSENKALELLDPSIKESFIESEVLKCIQVGLLCVQKFPDDRPTMSSVLSMLDKDGAMLPQPKQPGFYIERSTFEVESSSSKDIAYSENEATFTLLEGR